MYSPIHRHKNKWYFWDETWSRRIGPFDSRKDAKKKLRNYGKHLNNYLLIFAKHRK